MLLDDLMPRYDVRERHRTVVRAEPPTVYAALREANLAGGVVARTLLALRALPAVLASVVRSRHAEVAERRDRHQRRAVRLADLERTGFRVVAERAPDELVLGLLGSFWTPLGGICPAPSAESFGEGPPAGLALAAWNFSVHARGDGSTELRTETRVWCAADSRSKFRLYWLLVRPGSGLVRRSMLRAIRRQAEGRPAGPASPDTARQR